jgi:hypothetical protein
VKVLLPYLVGAASAFVVQFLIQIYVVPRAETAKRRRQRWEQDVLDLGELLSTTINDLAGKARSAQLHVRWAMEVVGNPNFDQAMVQRELPELKTASREAMESFQDQVTFRSGWMVNRIEKYRHSDKVGAFSGASRTYRLHLIKFPVVDDWLGLSEEDFEAWWDTERRLRTALDSTVRNLAFDRDALRTSWRARLRSLSYRTRKALAKLRRTPREAIPEAPPRTDTGTPGEAPAES